MEPREVLKYVDHSELANTATWEDVKRLCDDAVYYNTSSICIPPTYVKQAAEYLQGKMSVGTIIGYPLGYHTTAVKCFEAAEAIKDGANEVDVVVNLGWVKDGLFDKVTEEIKALRETAGDHILKIIIETGVLTEEEKIQLCKCVTEGGADYIKTCTGFGVGKATLEDVALFKEHIGPNVKIKASTGIMSTEEGEAFIKLGASRLGSKLLVNICKEQGLK